MRARLADQRGYALVIAVVLMALMMSIGLTAFAYVDTEQQQSGTERVRESAFNLAQGVLGAETFLLARKWPDATVNAFPRYCASTLPAQPRCPDQSFLASSYTTADYAAGSSWVVDVRDDGGSSSSFYDPSDDDFVNPPPGRDNVANGADDANDTATDAQPAWDANGNGRVWVRATATVRGKTRTLAALVNVNDLTESFPRNVVTAGQFTTGGNPHVMIQTNGSPVAIRNLGSSLWRASQIDIPSEVTQLTDGGKALSDRALDRLRQRAVADGTYCAPGSTNPNCDATTGCPTSLTGGIVFIESSPIGNPCRYTGNDQYNCPSDGLVVVASGGLYLGGTVNYCGVVYLANRSPVQTGTLLNLQGTASVSGAVAIDGPGGLDVGSNAFPNLSYDPKAIGAVKSYPSGSIVPSTWREIEG